MNIAGGVRTVENYSCVIFVLMVFVRWIFFKYFGCFSYWFCFHCALADILATVNSSLWPNFILCYRKLLLELTRHTLFAELILFTRAKLKWMKFTSVLTKCPNDVFSWISVSSCVSESTSSAYFYLIAYKSL